MAFETQSPDSPSSIGTMGTQALTSQRSWFLRFPPELENEYKKSFHEETIASARLSAVMVPIFLLATAAVQYVITRDLPPEQFWPSVSVLIFLSVTYVIMTHLDSLWRWHEITAAFGAVAYAGSIITLALQLDDRMFSAVFAFVLLNILGAYVAMGVRFPAATFSQGVVTIMWLWAHLHRGIYPSPHGMPFLLILYFVGTNAFGIILSRTMERQSRAQFLLKKSLAAETLKSERLLHQALPKSIAQRLATGERVADSHAEVGVLFADLVGFTRLVAESSPQSVVSQLNELFTAFDRLAEQEGLEKIKTIGDAWMAAAGVPQPCPQPALRCIRLACMLNKELETFNTQHGTQFALRIGIDVGMVVAGVIGKDKSTYDIWGDTVNTAARLESTGEPGKIQVSMRVVEATRGLVSYSATAARHLKGIGEMTTAFVEKVSQRGATET
jgi:class 3 adenylate cyclase